MGPLRSAILLALTAVLAAALVRSGASFPGTPRRSAPGTSSSPFPSFRIHPGSVTQTEPLIARHPHDDRMLFVAANTINLASGFVSEGVYATTDGGAVWTGTDTCPGAPVQFHRGDPGIAVDRNGSFMLTRLGFSPGLYAHRSADTGRTWSAQLQIASNDQDRADVATDGDPSSPYYGTTYAAWVRFSPPYPVFFSRTTDGGASWSVPEQVNSPSQRSQGADIEVGPGGVIYLCWAGVGSVSPFTEDYVGFARSTDGGGSWTVTENAFDINGIQGILPQKSNIRVNGLPRLALDAGPGGHRLYVVTTERNLAPAGSDPDLIVRSSADSGATWSGRVRINPGVNDGRIQYFPAVHVLDGAVAVLYYGDENTTSDSAGIQLAWSFDLGATWEASEIGDHRFRPQPVGGLGAGYQGDNIALSSTGDSLVPVWTDNSSGLYQLWTCFVPRPPGPNDVTDGGPLPAGYALLQNFPNPFNPSTEIRYRLPSAAEVRLTVTDLEGRVVSELVNGRQPAGSHRAVFAPGPGTMASGVYLCRLETPEIRSTVKLLYLK